LSYTDGAVSPSDFFISATPKLQDVVAGNQVFYQAAVVRNGTPAGSVTLNVDGLPEFASAVVEPAQILWSGNSNVAISTSAATPTGTYDLSVNATNGVDIRSSIVAMNVEPPAPQGLSATISPVSGTGDSGVFTLT